MMQWIFYMQHQLLRYFYCTGYARAANFSRDCFDRLRDGGKRRKFFSASRSLISIVR